MLLDMTVTARGPLAFPERRFGEQFRASLGYVPGGAIYGALGAHAFDAARFHELRCHNAYPVAPGDTWSRPLPMSALQPKGQEDGQIYDSLVERVCWEQQQPAGLIYAPTDENGRAWEMVKHGFYSLHGDTLAQRSVVQRVLTRVAIDRQRGTAAESRLYSPLVLNEVMQTPEGESYPSTFRGSIYLPDDAITLAKVLQSQQIEALGARQTSGLGAVRIEVAEKKVEDFAAIKDRSQRLTKRFRDQTDLYMHFGGGPCEITGCVFTVNLLSNAILREQGWLPTQELSAAALEKLTGIKANLLRTFSATAVVGGWHATWKQPKPTALATTMGSVFVFHAEGGLSESDFAALAKLQVDGIGERRPEGFGQVRICDEFHMRASYPRE